MVFFSHTFYVVINFINRQKDFCNDLIIDALIDHDQIFILVFFLSFIVRFFVFVFFFQAQTAKCGSIQQPIGISLLTIKHLANRNLIGFVMVTTLYIRTALGTASLNWCACSTLLGLGSSAFSAI